MTLAAKPFAAAVNHLLARESWARERLAPYAGKTARLACPPVVLTLLVQPDGYLGAVGETEAQQFDVTISVPSDALPAFVQGGQAAVMKHVKIEGDAEFATVIAKLAEHLRWEPEEDLANSSATGRPGGWHRSCVRSANTCSAPGATCSTPPPNICSTRIRNWCAAPRSTISTSNWRARATRWRGSKNASSVLEQKVEARGADAPGGAAMSRGTR